MYIEFGEFRASGLQAPLCSILLRFTLFDILLHFIMPCFNTLTGLRNPKPRTIPDKSEGGFSQSRLQSPRLHLRSQPPNPPKKTPSRRRVGLFSSILRASVFRILLLARGTHSCAYDVEFSKSLTHRKLAAIKSQTPLSQIPRL